MFRLVKVAVDTLDMLMPALAALLNDALSILFTVPLPVLGLVKFMLDSDSLLVDVNSAPWVVFWVVPPDSAVVPVPVPGKPPVLPVVLRMMPLVGPDAAVPAEMS